MQKRVTNTEKEENHLEWLFGLNPNAIENQEKSGQNELVNSEQLPSKGNTYAKIDVKKQYELMGIKVLADSPSDELFLDVELPAGWSKQPTDHSMWNNLVDDKGRIRGMFFYKAAFYDRDAFMNFHTRYNITTKYAEDRSYCYMVEDRATGEILFKTESLNSHNMGADYFKKQDLYNNQCKQFLDKNFPEHNDINAYW